MSEKINWSPIDYSEGDLESLQPGETVWTHSGISVCRDYVNECWVLNLAGPRYNKPNPKTKMTCQVTRTQAGDYEVHSPRFKEIMSMHFAQYLSQSNPSRWVAISKLYRVGKLRTTLVKREQISDQKYYPEVKATIRQSGFKLRTLATSSPPQP